MFTQKKKVGGGQKWPHNLIVTSYSASNDQNNLIKIGSPTPYPKHITKVRTLDLHFRMTVKPNLTFLFGPHLYVTLPKMHPYEKVLLKFKTNQA